MGVLPPAADLHAIAVFQAIQFLIFLAGIVVYSTSRKAALTAGESSACFPLGVATAKVLLFDVATAGPVVRILCLLTLGAALYVGGYLFRQIDRWSET